MYMNMKYDNSSLKDRLKVASEENTTLCKKIANLDSKQRITEQKALFNEGKFKDEVERLKQCIAEKDAQIQEISVKEQQLLESINLLQLEISTRKREIQTLLSNNYEHQSGEVGAAVVETLCKETQTVEVEEMGTTNEYYPPLNEVFVSLG